MSNQRCNSAYHSAIYSIISMDRTAIEKQIGRIKAAEGLRKLGLRAFGCRLRARSARSTFEKGNQKTFRLQWLPVCCCTMSSRASDAEDALMLKAVLATCGRPHREAQHMARHTHGRYRGTRVGRRDQSGDFED